MTRPLISVVIPTRLRAHLLPRAVGSVFNQTFRDFEALVIDDSPASRRAENQQALRPWAQDARLRYFAHDAPRNAATARNIGLEQALGEWITFLDDDDAYALRKLEAQLHCAQTSAAPVVLCGSRYVLGGRQRLRHCDRSEYRDAAVLLDAQSGSPFMFHRRAPDVRFDESLFAGEDADYFLRLVEHFGVSIVPNVPEPLVDVYPQPGDQRVNVRADALRQAQRALCLRHARRFGRDAERRAVARAELLRCRWRLTPARVLWRASCRLWRVGGRAEARLILNTWLLRVPVLRRFLVT